MMKLCQWGDVAIIRLSREDPAFYAYLGPFFGSRAAARELGMPIYDDPGRIWLVALTVEGPVGCGSLEIKNHKAALKSGWVLPEHRKKGLYNALFEERLKLAAEAGATMVTATCTDASRNTHLRHGFAEIGRRGRYYLMQKELTHGDN